jgi:hypothetical protein
VLVVGVDTYVKWPELQYAEAVGHLKAPLKIIDIVIAILFAVPECLRFSFFLLSTPCVSWFRGAVLCMSDTLLAPPLHLQIEILVKLLSKKYRPLEIFYDDQWAWCGCLSRRVEE